MIKLDNVNKAGRGLFILNQTRKIFKKPKTRNAVLKSEVTIAFLGVSCSMINIRNEKNANYFD